MEVVKSENRNNGISYGHKLRIVYLEDEPAHFELSSYVLKFAGYQFEMRRVETREEFISALTELKPDLILADYYLPKFSAPKAFDLVKEMRLDTPFIVVSGSLNEDLILKMMKIGVTDIVLKNHLFKLGLAVRRALIIAEKRRNRGFGTVSDVTGQ